MVGWGVQRFPGAWEILLSIPQIIAGVSRGIIGGASEIIPEEVYGKITKTKPKARRKLSREVYRNRSEPFYVASDFWDLILHR